MPIGTVARTGLVCIAVLAGLMLMRSKRRLLYGPLMGLAALAAEPFLPASFSQRSWTIQNYSQDATDSTRIPLWTGKTDRWRDPTGRIRGGEDVWQSVYTD